MSYLYGDSTTFPYDIDYIALARHAVDCSLQLLSAQQAIASALAQEEGQNQQRNLERSRLGSMGDDIESALKPFLKSNSEHTVQAAVRTLEVAKTCLEDLRAEEERRAADAASHAQHVIQRAGESALRALEGFLVQHDVPETEIGLTLSSAGEHSYSGEVSIRTPFGVSATFALRAGTEHAWSGVRRVGDLVESLEIHVPQPSGWISRRVEMATVKLDKMFVGGLRVGATELELTLRKSPGGGSGYRVSVDMTAARGVLLTPLDENGGTNGDAPLTLDGEDGARMLQLAQRVLDSVKGLTSLRGSMSSAALDDQPLKQLEWPETIAHRLLAKLAPVVMAISRRSGAPGELVLRRNVGDGRREEIYVTKAELCERLLVLPPERRAPFAALGLNPPMNPPPLDAPPLPIPVTVDQRAEQKASSQAGVSAPPAPVGPPRPSSSAAAGEASSTRPE